MSNVYGLLGIAVKAGRVQSGLFLTKEAVTRGRACLVIAAADAKENTVRELENACAYYKVPMVRFGSKEELGEKTGKASDRSCLAVTDPGFADALQRLIDAAQ